MNSLICVVLFFSYETSQGFVQHSSGRVAVHVLHMWNLLDQFSQHALRRGFIAYRAFVGIMRTWGRPMLLLSMRTIPTG